MRPRASRARMATPLRPGAAPERWEPAQTTRHPRPGLDRPWVTGMLGCASLPGMSAGRDRLLPRRACVGAAMLACVLGVAGCGGGGAGDPTPDAQGPPREVTVERCADWVSLPVADQVGFIEGFIDGARGVLGRIDPARMQAALDRRCAEDLAAPMPDVLRAADAAGEIDAIPPDAATARRWAREEAQAIARQRERERAQEARERAAALERARARERRAERRRERARRLERAVAAGPSGAQHPAVRSLQIYLYEQFGGGVAPAASWYPFLEHIGAPSPIDGRVPVETLLPPSADATEPASAICLAIALSAVPDVVGADVMDIRGDTLVACPPR